MKKLLQSIQLDSQKKSGVMLIGASVVSNFINLVYNVYLGHALSIEQFALVSFISSLIAIAGVLFGSLGITVSHRAGYLIGKYGEKTAVHFWEIIRRKSIFISLGISILWLAVSPFLIGYFKLGDIAPLLLFSPIFLVGLAAASDRGLLFSKFGFIALSILIIAEPLIKLALGIIFVLIGFKQLAYVSIPLSTLIAFFLGWKFITKSVKKQHEYTEKTKINFSFPSKFFSASLLAGISTMIFLNLDVILAKHFLSSQDAGIYALIALIAKMIFFLGSLATVFTIPLVSRNEGANVDSRRILRMTFLATVLLTVPAFLMLTLLGNFIIPLVFGQKAIAVLPYIALASFAMVCFSLSRVYTDYYLAKKYYSFPVATFILGAVQLVILELSQLTLSSFIYVMCGVWIASFVLSFLLHIFSSKVKSIENNIIDFLGIFAKFRSPKNTQKDKLRILVFNWRDTKHIWAGGAELYVHELAKRWVRDGNSVTVFCGNDGRNPRNEIVEGVQIVRRGGFYTVYLWAAIYYVLKFRRNYDVIVDSENGVPFFSPLFSTKPVILLAHHVNQQIFLDHLPFPRAQIARFVEAKIMPFIYRNQALITVSESSKNELIKAGIAKPELVQIINPGIEQPQTGFKKTKHPSLIYFGRLKTYKNIDIAIRAFAKVLKKIPDAKLYIAGEGDSMESLHKLVAEMKLQKSVIFFGKVSEEEKIKLLSESWVALQPSQVEGWGITVLEANACGTPVIASNVNGLRDSIVDGKTGILTPVRNINSLSKTMYKVLTRPKYREYLTANAREWSRKFSWDTCAIQFHNYLLAETRRGKSGLIARKRAYSMNKVPTNI